MKAIIISISSDIGAALAKDWLAGGASVFGTYRTPSCQTESLKMSGARLEFCDVSDQKSVDETCTILKEQCKDWDVLVLAAGMLDPVGPFWECSPNEWATSLLVNCTHQWRIVHNLYPIINRDNPLGSLVLFFAGSGTNGPAPNYSAYTVSKIANIKMCELMDAECPDVRFCILGPGVVETKIHRATFQAGEKAGSNLELLMQKLAAKQTVPMDRVVECCNWILSQKKNIVSGRNFSLANDRWGESGLSEALAHCSDMYKLRRYRNDWPQTE